MPEPLRLAAKPSKCTEDDDEDEVDDVDDVGMIVLPAAAAALSIDSPGLNRKPTNCDTTLQIERFMFLFIEKWKKKGRKREKV